MPIEGHDKLCIFCGKPCNDVAGNPSEWPLELPHYKYDDKDNFAHIGCTYKLLKEAEIKHRGRRSVMLEDKQREITGLKAMLELCKDDNVILKPQLENRIESLEKELEILKKSIVNNQTDSNS